MKTLFFISLFVSLASHATQLSVEEGVFIHDPHKIKLPYFQSIKSLTIDHVSKSGYELYGPKGLTNWLEQQHVNYTQFIEYESADYPTAEQIERKIIDIHSRYPTLTKIINIGKTSRGRNLLFVKISNNPEQDAVKPEFKYISSMHGDEITGRELMIDLMEDLLAGYGKDEHITALIDNTEIFIMPSMNPDGSNARKRGNGQNVDINRDFPDFSTSDNQNTPNGRTPETKALMSFQNSRQFSLSANFHGGAEVVNYMWDTVEQLHPLNELLVELSTEYAELVPYMRDSKEFPKGITNGYAWYEVNGGMQDWSYFWHNDLQFTIELSAAKWPDYSDIGYYYRQNKPALLKFIELVHQGAGFVLTDSSGRKLSRTGGKVRIIDTATKTIGTFGFKGGEFYKVLPAGRYEFTVEGYAPFTVDVEKNKVSAAGGNYVKLSP